MDSMPIIKRSPDYWFDDGNIVLQTADTQFRVHRSLLARFSDVMKHCFEIPHSEEEETVEGCPILRLDDSTKDIENLCGLLFGMYQLVDFQLLNLIRRLFYFVTESNQKQSDSHTWKRLCAWAENMTSKNSK